MSYTNLLYHIVYATRERAPLITNTLRPRLHEYLGGTVRGLGGVALEVNGVADHVHILSKIRPTISVSGFMSKLNLDRRAGQNDRLREDLAGKRGSELSRSASRKSSACGVTFVIRKSIIASFRSKKNSKRCSARTILISMQPTCGDKLLSPASQALFEFSVRVPQARLRLARG
jgi:REP element-mobilizing transposase RayT